MTGSTAGTLGKLAGNASPAVGAALNVADAFAAGDNTALGYPAQGAEVDDQGFIVGAPQTSAPASGSASEKVDTVVVSVEDDFMCEDGGGLLWDADSFDVGSRR